MFIRQDFQRTFKYYFKPLVYTNKGLILILFTYFVFSLFSLIQGQPIEDEFYHLTMVNNFSNNFLGTLFGDSYIIANTPLPYVIVLFPSELFGINIVLYRIITIIFSIFSLLLFFILIKKINPQVPLFFVFILFFYPYFIRTSFSFYMVIYGIFFALIAYLLIMNLETYPSYFMTGLSSSLAILCQQFYIAIPAGLLTYMIIEGVNKKSFGKIKFYKIVLLILPILIPFSLFWKWGGFTIISSHRIVFSIWNITGVLTVIGLLFLPYTLQRIKYLKLRIYICIGIVSLILGIFFKPMWSQYYDLGNFTGFTFHAIELSKSLSDFIPGLLTIVLTFSGLTCLLLILNDLNKEWERIFGIIILFFILIYSFHILIGERHLIHLFILLFALTLTKINKQMSIVWLICMIFIGTTYFFYWFYDMPF